MDAMSSTLQNQQIELELEDNEGRAYIGITGKRIGEGGRYHEVEIYRTEDGRTIVYDGDKRSYSQLGNEPRLSFEEQLRGWLPSDVTYAGPRDALGISR
jgi:hypothetical protein